jgi:hypothetical protein
VFGLIAILLLTYFNHQAKTTYRKEEGEEYARTRIEEVLTDTVHMKYYQEKFEKQVLIDDAATAIKTVEPILFRKYGKEKILDERPYQAFRVDNYWLIKGSFPHDPGMKGGTFEIIIDSRDARVIRVLHYK